MFSRYPGHLVAEAVNPATGLPSLHDYPPTMKQVKEFLEPRWQQEVRTAEMRARNSRKRLPEPARDPVADKKIEEGLRELSAYLAAGFGPSSQP